jgi:hypothetical protein
MTIKLENFTATIDVTSVEVTSVTDNIKSNTASVSVLINGKYGTNLNGFTYTNSWEDSDVLAWVNVELEKYKQIL